MKHIAIAVMTGLWGGAMMLAMIGLSGPDLGLVLPATLGAALAGALMAPLFGWAHPVWAFVTPVLATILGAGLVGAYAGFPGDALMGLIVAPMLVGAAALQSPVTLLVWLLGAVTLRLTARYLHPTAEVIP